MARPTNIPVSPNTASIQEMAAWTRVASERINYLLVQVESLTDRVTKLEAK